MKTDRIRMYIIPHIPYLLTLWFCIKLGTAYRMADGENITFRLINTFQTLGKAIEDISPGLNPFDWLVGIIGAGLLRFVVHVRGKNAKKYRRDREYGTARWGLPQDIRPLTDPVFKNNVILTGTESLTMNTRPKNPAHARNLNCCVIGGSGSGKTRFWLTPNLLQAHSSYVVVDPKGGVIEQTGSFLNRQGYRIKVFNTIDLTKSMHYNPLAYIKTEADILKFVNTLILNTKGDGKDSDDPFWEKSETLRYCALIAYIVFEGPEEDRNLITLIDEIGYLPMEIHGANLFFQLIARRYEKTSTIFTSNKTFSQWNEVFADVTIASAILDRVLHHCTVINIKGESYRLKERKEHMKQKQHIVNALFAQGQN